MSPPIPARPPRRARATRLPSPHPAAPGSSAQATPSCRNRRARAARSGDDPSKRIGPPVLDAGRSLRLGPATRPCIPAAREPRATPVPLATAFPARRPNSARFGRHPSSLSLCGGTCCSIRIGVESVQPRAGDNRLQFTKSRPSGKTVTTAWRSCTVRFGWGVAADSAVPALAQVHRLRRRGVHRLPTRDPIAPSISVPCCMPPIHGAVACARAFTTAMHRRRSGPYPRSPIETGLLVTRSNGIAMQTMPNRIAH